MTYGTCPCGRSGPRSGCRCAFCERLGALLHPAPAAPITAALTTLLHELAEEIPDALHASFTLAALWADLARIAGEPLPRDVAAVLDAPLGLVPVAVPLPTAVEHTPTYAD